MAEKTLSRKEQIYEHYERRLRAWSEVCVSEHDRIEANEVFMALDQWPPADRERLKQREQPALSINQIISTVNLLSGREMTARLQPKPHPRSELDPMIVSFAEVLEEGMRTLRDNSEAEHEDSAGFRPQIAHGIGWVRHLWDEAQEDGDPYGHEGIPPYQMIWDPFGRKGNLADRKGQMHGAWIGVDELAEDMGMDDATLQKITSAGAHDAGAAPGQWSWSQVSEGYFYAPEERRIFVVRYEWKEREPVYTVATVDFEQLAQVKMGVEQGQLPPEDAAVLTQQILDSPSGEAEMGGEEFAAYRRQYEEATGVPLPTADYARGRRWRWHFAYIAGNEVIEHGRIPVGRFTYEAITGIPVVLRERTRYIGIVDLMRDGQEWKNRFLLLALQMAAVAVKNGLMIEKGHGLKIDEIENKMARPGFVLELPPGTLEQGKVQIVSPQQALTAGIQAMIEYADEAALAGTGLNKPALGQIQDPRRVAGTVVNALQQAANYALAPMTDSQRRFRKRSGTLTAAFLLHYHDEQTIGEIVGQKALYAEQPVVDPATGQPVIDPTTGQPQIQLVPKIPPKDGWPSLLKFQIKVDESPASTTSSTEFWEMMIQHGQFNQVLGDGFSGAMTWGAWLRLIPSNLISGQQREMLLADYDQQQQLRMAMAQAQPAAPPEG